MKKVFILMPLVLCLLTSPLFSEGSAESKAKDSPILYRFGHVNAPTAGNHIAYENWAKVLEEKTKGMVQVKIFPGGQLGGERDLPISVQGGTVDMAVVGPGSVSQFAKETNVFEAPFVFRQEDPNHWRAVVDGPMGQILVDKVFKASGNRIRILDWQYSGTRHLLTRRLVKTPADMAGLKIRVPDVPIVSRTFRAFGASPVPIQMSELYMALMQGVADGMEGRLDLLFSTKVYEAAKYILLIGWQHARPAPIIINEQAYQKMSEEQKKIFVETLRKDGSDFWVNKCVADEKSSGEKMVKDFGVTITTPPDMDEWRKLAKGVTGSLAEMWGGDVELYDKVQNYKP